MIEVQLANNRRFLFYLLFSVCIGLLLAQWQGFAHGVHHTHGQNESSDVATVSELSGGDHTQVHHCAAFDSLTLGFALTFHLASLPKNDARHELPKAYQAYQVSIKPTSSFEARAPPKQPV